MKRIIAISNRRFDDTAACVSPQDDAYRSIVSRATQKHESDHHDLWAQSGEFKTARQLVRALGIAQDRDSWAAVY